MLWQVIKDLVGKDISKISLPVFINEPLTALQKGAEMMCFCDEMFQKAIVETDPCKRMVNMATYNAATYFLIKGRTAKPFNPLLGETFEMLTDKIRFISE